MILDSLENSSLYEHLNPLFPKAFDYIKKLDFSKIETGKTELEGLNLFVGVSDSKLKNKQDAKLEAHNNYIDIQIPISKKETFGWSARETLKKPIGEFNTDKDIIFFEDTPASYFEVGPTDFAIFFPHDAHAPCIGEDSVKKIVIKIRIQ